MRDEVQDTCAVGSWLPSFPPGMEGEARKTLSRGASTAGSLLPSWGSLSRIYAPWGRTVAGGTGTFSGGAKLIQTARFVLGLYVLPRL